MKINYGQGEKEIVVSIYTLVLYEAEFKSDMIQDVFGKVVLGGDEDKAEGVITIDYRQTNWTSAVKALWACLKAADSNLPSFSTWSTTLGEVDLYQVVGTIVPEIQRNLFRTGASDSE